MNGKIKQSTIIIGHFVVTNLFLPFTLYRLGQDLYTVWFRKS